MATVAPSGGGIHAASEVTNNGTILGAGNIDTTYGTIKNDLSIVTIADDYGTAIGSQVKANYGDRDASTSDRAGVDVAKAHTASGTLAFNPSPTGTRSETFIIRGVSTKINNVANTALQVNGSIGDGRYDNIHGTIADRLIGSKADEAYDTLARPSTEIVPGRTKGSNAGDASTMVNPADGTAAVAGEIFPTLTLPGELTYHFGALGKPTTDGYKPKNAFES